MEISLGKRSRNGKRKKNNGYIEVHVQWMNNIKWLIFLHSGCLKIGRVFYGPVNWNRKGIRNGKHVLPSFKFYRSQSQPIVIIHKCQTEIRSFCKYWRIDRNTTESILKMIMRHTHTHTQIYGKITIYTKKKEKKKEIDFDTQQPKSWQVKHPIENNYTD